MVDDAACWSRGELSPLPRGAGAGLRSWIPLCGLLFGSGAALAWRQGAGNTTDRKEGNMFHVKHRSVIAAHGIVGPGVVGAGERGAAARVPLQRAARPTRSGHGS